MNRKERRRLEKQMGITKRRQEMTYDQRMKNLQGNIQTGKSRSKEMAEERKLKENEASDQQARQELSSLATTLMLRDELSWHEALEAAKVEIEEKYVQEEG